VIAVNDAGEILMIRRTDNGNWAVPGGAIDLGESVAQAAVRETFEESGIRCAITGIAGCRQEKFSGTRWTGRCVSASTTSWHALSHLWSSSATKLAAQIRGSGTAGHGFNSQTPADDVRGLGRHASSRAPGKGENHGRLLLGEQAGWPPATGCWVRRAMAPTISR
jgi:hypothetical protein